MKSSIKKLFGSSLVALVLMQASPPPAQASICLGVTLPTVVMSPVCFAGGFVTTGSLLYAPDWYLLVGLAIGVIILPDKTVGGVEFKNLNSEAQKKLGITDEEAAAWNSDLDIFSGSLMAVVDNVNARDEAKTISTADFFAQVRAEAVHAQAQADSLKAFDKLVDGIELSKSHS